MPLLKLNKKIKASTLIETLVASIIIVIAFLLFTLIWTSIAESYSKKVTSTDIQNVKLIHYKFINEAVNSKNSGIEGVYINISKSNKKDDLTLQIIDNNDSMILKKSLIKVKYE